jgi:glycosyltransferase involved in cell wall biosynthesis
MPESLSVSGAGVARVSLIICTKNRIGFLRETLSHLLPRLHDLERLLEVLVVDNDSTDGTSEMLSALSMQWSKLRYVFCREAGLSRARNKAISLAEGEILIWTDDDLIIGENWMERLLEPIDRGEAECVVGRIEIAAHLRRDWMKPFHRLWLAENIHPLKPQLIGANMAIRKDCFGNGFFFDPATGPGALGYMDDTLLGMRLQKSGKRIAYCDDAKVTHHFGSERLHRSYWIRTAKAAGRSTAYVAHHWEHAVISNLRLRILHQRCKLAVHLLKNSLAGSSQGEGIGESEFGIRKTLSYFVGMRRLRRLPYKY